MFKIASGWWPATPNLEKRKSANTWNSGTECGPFRAIEESTLAQLTKEEDRGDMYAWYSLLGGVGSALGLGLCGWLLHILDGLGWSKLRAYRAIFWCYSALGIVMLCIVLFLSKACEIAKEQPVVESSSSSVSDNEGIAVEENKTSITPKLSKFSRTSRIIVIKLCTLCAIDSFGCSLAPLFVNPLLNPTSRLTFCQLLDHILFPRQIQSIR